MVFLEYTLLLEFSNENLIKIYDFSQGFQNNKNYNKNINSILRRKVP